jgi:hypothetical protein
MSVKSPLGLVLYCYLNMPTINKTYIILSLTHMLEVNVYSVETNDDLSLLFVDYVSLFWLLVKPLLNELTPLYHQTWRKKVYNFRDIKSL